MTGALPVGGSQFSSDLSIAFSSNIDFANQLKFETSCTPENERIAEKVIVKDKDSSKTFEITKRQISQVLKERAVEIFTLIRQDIIEKLGVDNLPERIILSLLLFLLYDRYSKYSNSHFENHDFLNIHWL